MFPSFCSAFPGPNVQFAVTSLLISVTYVGRKANFLLRPRDPRRIYRGEITRPRNKANVKGFLSLWMKFLSVTIHMKATDQIYYAVVLLKIFPAQSAYT